MRKEYRCDNCNAKVEVPVDSYGFPRKGDDVCGMCFEKLSSLDEKVRKYFDLYNKNGECLGYGYSYRDGNCQVHMKSTGDCAWQFASIAESLFIEGVKSFVWRTNKN